ncbi:MerR family transcriptional regulator [Actinomadura livida]|uniref:DNA-binding transcriptional MerR regulator n=1 Tax=Actinomadura livida TaxID=79909 RepID=A0A7W7MWI1_9ACTN|nr:MULTISPECIES: MerR family transcriptional regulator [Actinomadura]MBB4773766.1 DNA-binding transcriptional MerR regulator [Actinomadura catellatispora]GGU10569.1 transcriptional regulator [Actinomadura livida]
MREAQLGVGAVAQRLGVAASTLRTWDRRYGIGPSGRSAGGHRRYTPADVARLETMQRQILTGVPPQEAARVALEAPPGEPPAPRAHGAGGNRVPLRADHDERQAAEVRGLARAAMALDASATAGTVRNALRRDGVVRAWDDLIAPVLIGIGRKHAVSGDCVEVEHLLSAVVLGCLAETPAAPPNGRPVLLACAPEEQHSLPVHALAAALAETGVETLTLGARVPPPALTAAIRRTGPNAVFVWSQTTETGDPAWLAELPASRPPYRLVVGGPGWNRDRLPPHITRVAAFPEAVTALASLPGAR